MLATPSVICLSAVAPATPKKSPSDLLKVMVLIVSSALGSMLAFKVIMEVASAGILVISVVPASS